MKELNNKREDRMKDTALIHHNWFDNKISRPFHSVVNYVFSQFTIVARGVVCVALMYAFWKYLVMYNYVYNTHLAAH